jgi:hypothetical protein
LYFYGRPPLVLPLSYTEISWNAKSVLCSGICHENERHYETVKTILREFRTSSSRNRKLLSISPEEKGLGELIYHECVRKNERNVN